MHKTNTTISYIISFLVPKSTLMIIGFESSHRRDFNGPSIALIDQTSKNGSNSNFISEKVGRSILTKPRQLETRYHIKCHYRKKPCGISLSKYL